MNRVITVSLAKEYIHQQYLLDVVSTNEILRLQRIWMSYRECMINVETQVREELEE